MKLIKKKYLRSKNDIVAGAIKKAEQFLNSDPGKTLVILLKTDHSGVNNETAASAEFIRASAYRNKGDWNSAILHFEASLKLREKGKNKQKYAKTLSALGKCYYYTAQPDKAIKLLNKALKIQQQINDNYEYCRTLIFIANVYEAFTNEIKRPEKLYNKALVLSRKIKNRNFEASSLGGLSTLYFKNKKYSDAVSALNLAEKLYSELKNPYMLSQVYNELGRIYFEMQKIAESKSYYIKLETISRKLNNYNSKAEAFAGLALCSFAESNIEKFNFYNNKLERSFKKLQDRRNIFEYYKMFADVFYKLGDINKAFIYSKKYNEEYIKFRDEQIENQMKHLLITFEKEQAEKESEILKLRNNELKKEIETKTSELNQSANYIVQKNEFLNRIIHEINNYIRKTDIGRMHRDNLMKFLTVVESRNRLNKDMVTFENRLNVLNMDFIKKLSRKFPSLSPVELKLCSLMKINLGTKEIAKLLFISSRTVETHRHHIIKKLKLPKSQNLINFINTL